MSEQEWKHGDIVQDANGNVAQRVAEGDGWYVLGWWDQSYPTSDLELPLTRLVPEPVRTGKRTYVYRITKEGGDVKVGPVQRLAGMLGVARTSLYRKLTKIERVVLYDSDFEDITSEYENDRGVRSGG